MVNSEIRFHQKRVEAEEGLLNQTRALICSEGSLRMLFEVELIHVSDFGIGAGNTTNC